jgi:transposase
MAHLHKKIKRGRPYYYVREIARVDGKPKVVNQVYIGTAERILDMAREDKDRGHIRRLQTREFGSLFVANLVENKIGVCEIIDEVLPRKKGEKGPTIGEYFLFSTFNRMIQPRSKKALPEWLDTLAVQDIRPVDTRAMGSEAYWRKWDRVTEAHIQEIARRLFLRVHALEPEGADCFLFDTTNYFTYMDSKTPSDLAVRGKNKDGKDLLRQVGLALLITRTTGLPLFFREYEGNCHDSKLFNRILGEVFEAMQALGRASGGMTVVFDKGINAEANIEAFDGKQGLDFITTYSTYFAQDLAETPLDKFSPADTPKNRRLKAKGREEDLLLAWRTAGVFWGKERTVVVTYNPLTASKKRYRFDRKLLKVQEELFAMRSKVLREEPHWRKPGPVRERYESLCESLYLPDNLYDLELYYQDGRLRMSFRKNYYQVNKYLRRFGKNIIITSHHGWTTDEIVCASLDRCKVEDSFRQSKSGPYGSIRPMWHWTDGKIRCHLLCCIIALTYLQLLELWLGRAGLSFTADRIMDHMRELHSSLCWNGDSRKPQRIIEDPGPEQAEILAALGFKIDCGVLQPASA